MIINKNVYIFNLIPRSVQLVARIKTLVRAIIRASRCTLQYEITPRSVQLVARNRQSRTEVKSFSPVACNLLHEIVNTRKVMNNVLWVVHSCIKMHATDEIMNTRRGWIKFRAWFGRASRCTLHGITRGMCRSCFKMHATIWKKTPRWANVKQCKLKGWGVAVVDLWLFFEYHAEVKV